MIQAYNCVLCFIHLRYLHYEKHELYFTYVNCVIKMLNMKCYFGLIFSCIVLQNKNMFALGMDEYVDSKTASLYAQYECQKLKECTPGRGQVCGFSPNDNYLVMFEDECVMHRVNCKALGKYLFHQVEKQVCDTRTNYENQHKEEKFEWEHITRSPPTVIITTERNVTIVANVTTNETKSDMMPEKTTAGDKTSKFVWLIKNRTAKRMTAQTSTTSASGKK